MSQTPAGWYPSEGQERFWDGTQWTDQRRPAGSGAQIPQSAPFPHPSYAPQPHKQKHTLRNVLLILIAVAVLFMAGCTALVVVGVGGAVNEATKSDKEPGGPDNPMEITPGEAFEVNNFNYASGWTVRKDIAGDVDVKGRKVTNNRDGKDSAIVEIKFWSGSEVLALTDCTTSPIDPGSTVTVSCISADRLPRNYDKVTINDTF